MKAGLCDVNVQFQQSVGFCETVLDWFTDAKINVIKNGVAMFLIKYLILYY